MGVGFLDEPTPTDHGQRLRDDDVAEVGYVMNVSRLWGYQPATLDALFALLAQANAEARFSLRERAIMVTACASAMGDSYCSLAWGGKLSNEAGAEVSASVLRGADVGLTEAERALAAWARVVAQDPSGTTAADVQDLRSAGWSDEQIFAMTTWIALRMAFSTVNDALGAQPDTRLVAELPAMVADAVTWGRPVERS